MTHESLRILFRLCPGFDSEILVNFIQKHNEIESLENAELIFNTIPMLFVDAWYTCYDNFIYVSTRIKKSGMRGQRSRINA